MSVLSLPGKLSMGRSHAGMWLPAATVAVQGLNVAASTQGASTPDQAFLNSGTGQIDLRVRATLTSWNNGSFQALLAQRQANADTRWELQINTTGKPSVTWFGPGASNSTVTSSVATPFANGGTGWVRVVVDFTTTVVTFYTATDATGSSWTQLGSTGSAGSSGLQVAGTPPAVKVGQDLFANFAPGKIHRAQVYIATVLKIDMDFSSATVGNGPWVAGSGETWTRIGTSTVS